MIESFFSIHTQHAAITVSGTSFYKQCIRVGGVQQTTYLPRYNLSSGLAGPSVCTSGACAMYCWEVVSMFRESHLIPSMITITHLPVSLVFTGLLWFLGKVNGTVKGFH